MPAVLHLRMAAGCGYADMWCQAGAHLAMAAGVPPELAGEELSSLQPLLLLPLLLPSLVLGVELSEPEQLGVAGGGDCRPSPSSWVESPAAPASSACCSWKKAGSAAAYSGRHKKRW